MSGIKYIANVLNQKGAPAIFEDTLANRPSAGYVGRIFISTDTFVIQRDNGTTWDSIGVGGGITGTGAAGQVTFFTGASAVSGDNGLFWDNTNKRLGINTITPGVRLDIHGTSVIAQFNGTTTNNAYLDFQNAGSTQWRIGNQYAAAVNRFSIFNAAGISEVFTILQGGNIGVDTITPLEKFEVIGRIQSRVTTTGAAYFNAQNSLGSTTFGTDSLGGYVQTNYLAPIRFNTNSTINMVIDAGKIGIGYTAPAITGLSVSGSIYQGLNVANSNYEMFCSGNLYSPGFAFNITTVSVNTPMTRTSCAYVCTATLTLTLPAVSGLNNQFYVIARTGATVTVQRAGSDTITDKTGTTGLTSVTVAAGTRSMFYLGGGSETIQIF